MARRATFIKAETNSAEWVLVLDAGNSLVGDMDPALRTQGGSSIETMNRMGYHAMALGSGDLALGLDVLRQRISDARFAILSANAYTMAGQLVTRSYAIFTSGSHRVAVVGLTDGPGTAEVVVRDPIQAVREAVAGVRNQVSAVVILSHAGLEIDRQIADTVPGVSAIVAGGEHSLPQPWISPIAGVPVYHADAPSPGHAGRLLGVARLGFDATGKLMSQTWRSVALGPEFAEDPDTATWVAAQLTR